MVAGGMDPDRTSSDELLARAAKGSKRDAPAAQPAAGEADRPAGGQARGQGRVREDGTRRRRRRRRSGTADALAHVAKLTKHDDDPQGVRVGEQAARRCSRRRRALHRRADEGSGPRLRRPRDACCSSHAVGKAADLEAVEDVLKAAEGDKIGRRQHGVEPQGGRGAAAGGDRRASDAPATTPCPN
jgi:hypothetical protein